MKCWSLFEVHMTTYVLLPLKKMATTSTGPTLEIYSEGERPKNIYKVPYMLMGFLTRKSTTQPFQLQQLQDGSCNVEHKIPFSWR